MAQLGLLGGDEPFKITHVLRSDPLDPDGDAHGICRVYNAKERLLASCVVILPRWTAASVHSKAVEASLSAYEGREWQQVCRAYRQEALRVRRQLVDIGVAISHSV